MAGEDVRGASTITMQVARNLFLWNGQSIVRKGLEIPLALYIDLVLPKRRIMEIYLNIAEWGPNGQFGVVAGARAAFGVEPAGSGLAHGDAAGHGLAQSDAAPARAAVLGHGAHCRHHRETGCANMASGPIAWGRTAQLAP